MTLIVPLTKGYYARVDDEDFDKVIAYSWHVSRTDKIPLYALAYGNICMHRLILGIDDTRIKVDHRDGDGLNCQRYNMRLTDTRGNARNTIKSNATGYRGVEVHRRRFRAHIRDDTGYKRHLGSFDTPEEAALAYDDAARMLHGEFGIYNFPREGERGNVR